MEIGVDIVEIKRIERACKRTRFLERFFTERELLNIRQKKNPYPHIAGKYAAKEAIAKSLGTGFRNFRWHHIEILNDPLGKPKAILSGKALDIFRAKGLDKLQITISHSREYAVAFAVALRGENCESSKS